MQIVILWKATQNSGLYGLYVVTGGDGAVSKFGKHAQVGTAQLSSPVYLRHLNLTFISSAF